MDPQKPSIPQSKHEKCTMNNSYKTQEDISDMSEEEEEKELFVMEEEEHDLQDESDTNIKLNESIDNENENRKFIRNLKSSVDITELLSDSCYYQDIYVQCAGDSRSIPVNRIVLAAASPVLLSCLQ